MKCTGIERNLDVKYTNEYIKIQQITLDDLIILPDGQWFLKMKPISIDVFKYNSWI